LTKPQSVTSLEASPEDERRARMKKYTIAMTVRMVCIVLGVFLEGWLMWAAFAGAIFLPYFAVVLANSSSGSLSTSTKAVAPKLTLGAERFRDAQ
jgi:predicted tellurium resistance membrane protein TerC